MDRVRLWMVSTIGLQCDPGGGNAPSDWTSARDQFWGLGNNFVARVRASRW